MGTEPSAAALLVVQAEQAWSGGHGSTATALYERAAAVAEVQGELEFWALAVLGLARGQHYNVDPGLLPVRLHTVYEMMDDPTLRSRLASALARCWAYTNEPRRARPFAIEALHLADRQDDPVLVVDALDAALASHWGPDDLAIRREWAVRMADTAAHLADLDARLQAQLWALTVAWEVLDLPRMHRSLRAIELLGEESPRAEFFAATRRLPLELLRANLDAVPMLVRRAAAAAEQAVIPDAAEVLQAMRGYAALVAGDAGECADRAPAFEQYAVDFGVAVVRAEAAMIWLGAGRLDKVADMIGAFTGEVLANLARDSDWLLILQCVLEGAIALQDVDMVDNVVALLAPYAGRSVVNGGAVMWHGVTDDTLARAYALLGDNEAAAGHRIAALATYQRIGASWWRDRLQRELAEEVGSGVAVRAEVAGVPRPARVHLHQQPGGLWLVGREGATFVLPQMRGLSHLHALISRPNTDLTATWLASGETAAAEIVQPGIEVLDDESRRVLAARMTELDAELSQLDHDEHDGEVTESELTVLRAERAELHGERDAITAYLSGAVGLGGRRRTTGSNAERARVAVRKAIVTALARIAETDRWLGRHLRDRVHTGYVCHYEADPDHPVHWILHRGR